MFFNRKKDPEPVIAEPVEVKKPEPEKPKGPDLSPMAKTIIGSGITFFGDFETSDPIELNGTIRGDINSDSAITISRGAEYFGNANMHSLNVSGVIQGDIDCKDTSTFTSTAQMTGDLKTAYLVTDKGSNFKGNLSLQKPDEYEEPQVYGKPTQTKAAEAPDWEEEPARAAEPEEEIREAADEEPEEEEETASPAEAEAEEPAVYEAEAEAKQAEEPAEEAGEVSAEIDEFFAKPGDAESGNAEGSGTVSLDEDGNPWNIDDYFKAPDNSGKLEKTDEISFEDRFAAIEKDAEALLKETDPENGEDSVF